MTTEPIVGATSSEDGPTLDPIEAAWREVDDAWEDEAAHKRFMVLATSLDRLQDAGLKYRQQRESNPERAEVAAERINELLSQAMVRLMSQATPSQPAALTRRRVSIVGFALALVLFGLALYGAFQSIG